MRKYFLNFFGIDFNKFILYVYTHYFKNFIVEAKVSVLCKSYVEVKKEC